MQYIVTFNGNRRVLIWELRGSSKAYKLFMADPALARLHVRRVYYDWSRQYAVQYF